MKNLFDLATKELTQDAFLRWLFENHNCENNVISHFANEVLSYFTNENITNDFMIETFGQYDSMDVVVKITNADKKIVLVIEDKTLSYIHNNQLVRYKEKISECIKDKNSIFYGYEPKFVFFKLNRKDIYDKKIKENEELEKEEVKCWQKVYLNDFYELIAKYECSNNNIFDNYKNYIVEKYRMYYLLDNTLFDKWDNRTFEIYCNEQLKPIFVQDQKCVWAGGWYYRGKGAYTWFQVNFKYDINLYLHLQLQIRENFSYYPLDLRFIYCEDKKEMIVKDEKKQKEIRELLKYSKFFDLRNSKGKKTIASLKPSINLKNMSLNEFEQTLKDIKTEIIDLLNRR